MRSISDIADRELIWMDVGRGVHEVRAGADVVVRTHPGGGRLWGGSTLVDVGDCRWVFKRTVAGWQWLVTVHDIASETEVARLVAPAMMGRTVLGGTLVMSNGRRFQWSANPASMRGLWLQPNGQPFITFKQRGWLTTRTTISIEPTVAADPALNLLVPLGCYLL